MDFVTGIPSQYNWYITAGARSIFMLPKITSTVHINRLCAELNITPHSVEHLADHWNLFRLIAQSEKFSPDWKNKIVFFGKEWFSPKNDSSAWAKFKKYLTAQGWLQAQYSILKINFSIEWRKYAEAISSRRMKPKLYILDQLKHILSIANGYYPAFIPADAAEEAAPILGLQQAFIDLYRLEEYFSTIMHISSVRHLAHTQPVYYSLSFPTLMEGSPLKKSSSTILLDIRQIKILIDTLKEYLHLHKDNTVHIVNDAQFDFFHIEKDKFKIIKQSAEIYASDANFRRKDLEETDRSFCATSQFFRGCVKISSKKQQMFIKKEDARSESI
jgi:hypothetical protein